MQILGLTLMASSVEIDFWAKLFQPPSLVVTYCYAIRNDSQSFKHTIFFGDDDFQIGWGSYDISIVG